ncbi:hypothetical protein RJ527_00050 [Thalassospiraceae bacterium LMO-SO8]|nr:hypothetical protein [Alphaproteobacteria bacterium LMO-S08]WND76147.1 hypothetical protein RJ527_00050 [Thalassospiraceae bacterium LMO-SO8]
MAEAVVITKEMALTRAGFFRGIAKALGTDGFVATADGVVLDRDGRRLEITLGPERRRRIALMEIETMDVTLIFSGYSKEERAAALAAFDRAFQRGGG